MSYLCRIATTPYGAFSSKVYAEHKEEIQAKNVRTHIFFDDNGEAFKTKNVRTHIIFDDNGEPLSIVSEDVRVPPRASLMI